MMAQQLSLFPESSALYFAFGSNMDEAQMATRCPSARPIDLCWLVGHQLVFRGHSQRWGGGVASVEPGNSDALVAGVLWALSVEDLDELDGYEGAAYQRIEVDVVARGNRGADHPSYRAYTYVMPRGSMARTRPTKEYLRQIREAYKRWGFSRARLPRQSWAVSPRIRRVNRHGLVVPKREALPKEAPVIVHRRGASFCL